MRGAFYILTFIFCFGWNTNAQFPFHLHYNVNDGLPSSEIYDITQDSIGSIWLGTSYGVSRFDGYNFRNFTTNDRNDTTVYLKSGERKIISKSLSNFEKLLSGYSFCRLHNSHMINLKYMAKYVKGKAGYVVMWDNKAIYISAHRKQHFLDKLNTYAQSL